MATKPNAATRRPFPFHPPYSLMIHEAIRHLSEEQGSTEGSISEHIKTNFDGLPPGHDRLLPYYLNKLTAQGEFVNGAEGRYLIAQDEEQEEGKVIEKPNFVKKRNPKATREVELCEDEGVPIECARDLVVLVKPLEPLQELDPGRETEIAQSEKPMENVVSLDGDDNGDGDGDVAPVKAVDPSLLETSGDSVQAQVSGEKENGDDMSRLEPRRRGRGRKRKHESKEDSSEKANVELPKSAGGRLKLVVKRLGRPPKINHQSMDSSKEAGCFHVGDVEKSQLVGGVEPPKQVRRESPVKINRKPVIVHIGDDDNDVQLPVSEKGKGMKVVLKRLGRPPKDTSKDAIVHVQDVEKLQLADTSLLGNNGDAELPPMPEGGGKSKLVPKRPGRAPKQSNESTDHSSKEGIAHIGYVDNNHKVKLLSSSEEEGDVVEHTESTKQVPKRRGRPPKSKEHDEDVEMIQMEENENNDKYGCNLVPKGQGRRGPKSKKSSNEEGRKESNPVPNDESKVAADVTPKRRGRPPKPKHDDLSVGGDLLNPSMMKHNALIFFHKSCNGTS